MYGPAKETGISVSALEDMKNFKLAAIDREIKIYQTGSMN